MTPQERTTYLEAVITNAARDLRGDRPGPLVASDLEDSLRWSEDPERCAHPFWDYLPEGAEVCRTCGADVSNIDPMGG